MGNSIIYSKMIGKNDPMYGKFEHPIKAIISNESNAWEKNKTLLKALFNIEKSNRYAESIIGESDFDTFQAVKEGQGAENDSYETTFKKVIEHIAFMKEFTITKEMADDAKVVTGDMKNKARRFVRAYYKTQNKIGAWALVNGTKTSDIFNKARVDLTAPDGLPLFSNAHTYFTKSGTQSNYYCNGTATTMTSTTGIEDLLNTLSNKMRNIKDETGESLNYVADVVIVPANRPKLEAAVKKVVGSERTVGSNDNDINTQYGNWTVVVLEGWELATGESDKLMVMSSEANKELMGNMFYNRVALDIQSEVDIHTRNAIWNGYTRFGVGFGSWKHIMLFDDAQTNAAATTI